MPPGPSKKRLAPSDKRVQSEQLSKRKRDNERPYYDKIDEDYNVYLSGLTISRNSLVYDGKDGNQHRYDESAYERRSDYDTEGSLRLPPSSGRMTPEQRSEGERGEERVQTPYHDNVEEPYDKFLSGLRISGDSLVYQGKDGKQFRYDEFSDPSRSDSGTEGSYGPPPSIGRMTPEHSSEVERGEERVQTPYHGHIEEPYYELLSGLRLSGDSLVYEGKDGKQFRYDQFSGQNRSDFGTEGSHGPPPSIGRMTPEQLSEMPEQWSEGERGEERVQSPNHDNVEEPYYEFLSGLQICGDSLVYEGKDGKQFRYDEFSDESTSDSI